MNRCHSFKDLLTSVELEFAPAGADHHLLSCQMTVKREEGHPIGQCKLAQTLAILGNSNNSLVLPIKGAHNGHG